MRKPKIHKKRNSFSDNIHIYSEQKLRKFFLTAIGGFLIIASFYVIFFSSLFFIQFIEVKREDVYVDSNEVKQTLNKYFKKNLLFISTGKIKNDIKGKFPIISVINIQRKFPNTLKINLTSFPSVANIKIKIDHETLIDTESRGESSDIEPLQQKALINTVGYVIHVGKENLQLPTISLHDQQTPVKMYDLVIPHEHLDRILESYNIIKNNLQFNINEIIYYLYGKEMRFQTDKGFSLWMDFEDTPQNQIDKLKKVLSQFDLDSDPPQYFYLRIKNRIIYK